MSGKYWPNAYRSTILCIDSYGGQILSGRFYNAFCPEGIRFHGVMDLLLQMENMLDQMEFPQSFSMVRSFSDSSSQPIAHPPESRLPRGELATFEVKVLFRQNTSWQGSLHWMDRGREEGFRSVLELLHLIDSALSPSSG